MRPTRADAIPVGKQWESDFRWSATPVMSFAGGMKSQGCGGVEVLRGHELEIPPQLELSSRL